MKLNPTPLLFYSPLIPRSVTPFCPDCCVLLYRQMSASASKRNWDTAADNETLFDFLKRKKKYALESTVNKTLHHHSSTRNRIDLDADDDFPQVRDDRTRLTQYQSNNEANRGSRPHITPKKIDFQEAPLRNSSRPINREAAQVVQQTQQGKSFLSMISPIKNRPASALQQKGEERESQPKSGRKSVRGSQSFSKKNVTKSINSIKSAMHSLNDTIKSLREKAHGLVVHFNPLFNCISETNAPVAKQVGDFRNRLRAFEALLTAADVNSIDQVLESFHKNLEQHMQFEEGQMRRALEKARDEQLDGFKAEKEQIVNKLQVQNKKLSKEVDLLARRLQRAQNSQGDLAQAVTERQINSLEQIQRIKQQYQTTIEQLKVKNEQLSERCKQISERNKQLQKECKNQRFGRQGIQQRSREQMQKIIEAKDAYLINQIMVLKTEFNADLARINELHKIKEAQLLNRIAAKEQQLNKKAFQRGCDRQIQAKIMEEASLVRQQNEQLKAKAECIITDMYRMNQELYQHWMALKDVKALATRLGSFAQYKKIYEDLHFNDHLFH